MASYDLFGHIEAHGWFHIGSMGAPSDQAAMERTTEYCAGIDRKLSDLPIAPVTVRLYQVKDGNPRLVLEVARA